MYILYKKCNILRLFHGFLYFVRLQTSAWTCRGPGAPAYAAAVRGGVGDGGGPVSHDAEHSRVLERDREREP